MIEVPLDIKEKIIKTNESIQKNKEMFHRLEDKPGFEFLKPDNEYHEFYLSLNSAEVGDGTRDKGDVTDRKIDDIQVREYKYLNLEPNKLATIDLEIIKLTAQLISVNGQDYKERLINYIKDPLNSLNPLQFEFLNDKDESSMHRLFEYYLKIYQGVLELKDLDSRSHQEILDDSYTRAESEVKKYRETRDKVSKQLKLDMEYASINWDEFSVVETIEFSELEMVSELNLPLNKNELEMRSLLDKRANLLITDAESYKEKEQEEKQGQEEDEVEEEEDTAENKSVQNKPMRKGIKIKSSNESRIFKANTQQQTNKKAKLIMCPLTGQLIPEDRFAKHIKILLQDTRYQEYQDRYERKFKFNKIDEIDSDDVLKNIKSLINN